MAVDVFSVAQRVKRGVKLLDKKVPNWRQVLHKHRHQFNFRDGECCVLGTLEHYSGRMQVLRRRQVEREQEEDRFRRAAIRLNLGGTSDFGFDINLYGPSSEYSDEYALLDALWRAEFEPLPSKGDSNGL